MIRTASITDLEQILALNKGLFEFESQFIDTFSSTWTYSQTGRHYFTRRLTEPTSICYVAEVDSSIVGYACGYFFNHPARDPMPMAEIENIFVSREHRRKGIGQELMQEFAKWAKDRGAVRLKVVALEQNQQARKFYEQLGYHMHEVIYELKLDE